MMGAPSLPHSCFCGKGGISQLLAALLLSVLPLSAQYPGQVTKSSRAAPELRAIAVLEWTGEPGHPKTSRLVPIAVLDAARLPGDQLQDAGLYLARPQPLALSGEVEYELQQNGKPIGLFDIKNAGQEQGSWVGYGSWKPLPRYIPKPTMAEVARSLRDNDEDSDQPILHRKHPASESSSETSSSSTTTSAPSAPAPAPDSDRPTLHKRDSSSDSSSATTPTPSSAPAPNPDQPTLHRKDSGSDTANSTSPSPSPSPDSDRPTLHKRDSSDSSTAAAPSADPDRPVLKSRKKPPEDIGHAESLPDVTDPNRPRLKRGKSSNGPDVLPTLMGLPPDMQQAVAVSDAKSHPEHPWTFIWANPDDEAKMKSALEDMARDALGLNPPPPPPSLKKTTPRKNARPAPKPPPPAPLLDENFRAFELAYGSGATLVLTAHTDGPLAQQKFVALIAQPDLYGNLIVLLKYVAGGAHLDDTPRMRLVDAVDALADNRGELLFELRGQTQRQFALYRILRGQAEKLFTTGAGAFGAEN
jgi:hypothetical protein